MDFYCDKYKEIRKEQHISMEILAKKAGVSRRTLWSWENGVRIPSENKTRLLADKLNISVEIISNLPKEYPTSPNLSQIAKQHDCIPNLFHDDHDKTFNDLIYKINHYRNDLKKASSIIKGLLSSMNAMFYIKDINLNYIVVNELFKNLTGTDRSIQIPGKKDAYFFSKEEAKFNSIEDEKVILTGKSIINREDYIPGSRKRKWGLISKLPILDEDKKITGIVATFVDITKRKKDEKYRKQLEEAINKIDTGIWLGSEVTDISGNKELHIDFFNKTAEEKYGLTKEKAATIKDKCCAGCVFDNKHCEGVLKSKSFPVTQEHRLIFKNNQEKIIEEKIFKYDDSQYIGILNDITILKKFNSTMELLEININSLKDGLAIRDIDTGEFLYLNNAMESIFGYTTSKLYNKSWSFLLKTCLHSDYIEDELKYNELKQWPSGVRTIKAFRADGKERWINISSSYRKYMGRNCLISIFRDTTAKKTTDEISNILDSISDAVSICQKETFKLLYASKAVIEVFGYPKIMLNSKNVFDALKLCIYKEDLNTQTNYYKTGNIPKNRTYRIQHSVKGIRTIESRTTEVKYMGKECWFMICRDITEGLGSI